MIVTDEPNPSVAGQVQHHEGQAGEGGRDHDERAGQFDVEAAVRHRRQSGPPPEEAEGGQRAGDRPEGRQQGM